MRSNDVRAGLDSNSPKRILAVGHSHMSSLMKHCQHETIDGFEFTFLNLLSEEFPVDDKELLRSRVTERIGTSGSQFHASALFISGNEHQIIGLVNSDRPFDFIMPGMRHAFVEGHEIVPYGLIQATLAATMREDLYALFSDLLPGPIFQIEPPPPILDEDHIRAYPGYFAGKIDLHGISHPHVRHKLWVTYSQIAESWSRKYGMIYLKAPREGMGPEGFLHSLALSNDPTHGNAWYGGLIAAQLEQALKERAAHG